MKNPNKDSLENIRENKKDIRSLSALSDDEIDEFLLSIITSEKKLLHSKTIETIILQFFEAISTERYLDAWHLISPDYQQTSIWGGELKKFDASFFLVKSISDISIGHFCFSSFSVKCIIEYQENGISLDFKSVFEALKSAYNSGEIKEDKLKIIHDDLSKIYSFEKSFFDWIPLTQNEVVDFLSIDEQQLLEPTFQKAAYSILVKKHHLLFLKGVNLTKRPYTHKIRAVLSLSFEYDRWLINKIQIYPDSKYDHFANLLYNFF